MEYQNVDAMQYLTVRYATIVHGTNLSFVLVLVQRTLVVVLITNNILKLAWFLARYNMQPVTVEYLTPHMECVKPSYA